MKALYLFAWSHFLRRTGIHFAGKCSNPPVLPFGIRSQHETAVFPPGADPGAPIVPGLGAKMLWTTVLASVIFGAFYGVYTTKIVSLDDLATLWGLLP